MAATAATIRIAEAPRREAVSGLVFIVFTSMRVGCCGGPACPSQEPLSRALAKYQKGFWTDSGGGGKKHFLLFLRLILRRICPGDGDAGGVVAHRRRQPSGKASCWRSSFFTSGSGSVSESVSIRSDRYSPGSSPRLQPRRPGFVSIATIRSSSTLASLWFPADRAPHTSRTSCTAPHSKAEPRAILKYRGRSPPVAFPSPSAMFSGTDCEARNS